MFKAAANVNVPISTCTAKVEWMERQEWMGGQADEQMSLSERVLKFLTSLGFECEVISWCGVRLFL